MSAVHQLTQEDLVAILTEPRNALVKQFQRFFSFDGIELVFSDDALVAVAEKALERETGARGLRSIIEEVLLEVQFELPSRRDVKKCVVTRETVEKGLTPTLVTEAVADEAPARRDPRRDRLNRLSGSAHVPTPDRCMHRSAGRVHAPGRTTLLEPHVDLASRTRFEPAEVEPRITREWLESGLWHPEPEGDAAENYSIAIPPPNITGALHMGHALNGSIQDALIRHHRMTGRRTKWIFGTDHASIATQRQVEQELREPRHEPRGARPRGASSSASGAGASATARSSSSSTSASAPRATTPTSASRSTPAYADAVLDVFVALYERGYIHRDHYMVNWDPGSGSAISDLEVEEREETDTLYSIAYPIADGSGELVVATVRPGDDAGRHRRRGQPGRRALRRTSSAREVVLPLVGRRLPVIADDYVKPDFGTGALKVTPGHDPNDFEIGRRHGLAAVQRDRRGRAHDRARREAFAGLTVAEARAAVVAALERDGRAARPASPTPTPCRTRTARARGSSR